MTDDPAARAQDVLIDLSTRPPTQRVRAEAAIVSRLVDDAYYTLVNAASMTGDETPAEHFCRTGWSMLRKPNPDFDTWWYWANHLDPAVDDVNPLVHYALLGRDLGLSTRPDGTGSLASGVRPGTPVRRAVLFAGYDAECVVDEAALLLIEELARHADVYYLCDGYLPPDELDKLAPFTRGAWAVRHGGYDFGSYSLLARELVGWHRLEDYDEVLLVNDSCFLVRPLDEVFATMHDRACDWWGLQATKGLFSTRDNPANAFTEPIPIDSVRSAWLARYEDDPVYDFHLGSYFLAFRRPVLDDPVFRRLLDSVHRQPNKLLVILKYEIGLTHLLVGRGHSFDTFVPHLHPFHPLFTETHFRLIDEGFPLLKRYLISQNHYDIPGLASWPERLRAAVPDAPVDVFERTLRRTAPDDRMQRSLAVVETASGAVEAPSVVHGKAYRRLNDRTAKRPDVWSFAVDPVTHRLPEGSRAVYESVADDPAITKVVLTRSRHIELPGRSVVVEPVLSPGGREQLMRSGLVVLGPAGPDSLQSPPLVQSQTVVSARAGYTIRPSERTRPEKLTRQSLNGPLELVHDERPALVSALLVASDLDRLLALAVEWQSQFSQTWMTGLPFHDLLLRPDDELPADYRAQLDRLTRELDGRRLVLLAPDAPLPSPVSPYVFDPAQREHLQAWARSNDVVLGVREDVRDLRRPYWAQLGDVAIDLSPLRYPSQAVVLRAAAAVVTDWSASALDFAMTGRPVLGFAHDEVGDQLLLDLDHTLPGPVAHDFDELVAALDELFTAPVRPEHALARRLLLGPADGRSTERALDRIRPLLPEVI
ncbi:rhamnan synthesis F family protein [Nocardioides sp. C4-1]|uniref:rhamnan synthesis F family protein n=1 Tax=Nocardioides sp. C4-1 TaxID=3151851 RepID=UPI00326701D3